MVCDIDVPWPALLKRPQDPTLVRFTFRTLRPADFLTVIRWAIVTVRAESATAGYRSQYHEHGRHYNGNYNNPSNSRFHFYLLHCFVLLAVALKQPGT